MSLRRAPAPVKPEIRRVLERATARWIGSRACGTGRAHER